MDNHGCACPTLDELRSPLAIGFALVLGMLASFRYNQEAFFEQDRFECFLV
jgi:hypothetical protein